MSKIVIIFLSISLNIRFWVLIGAISYVVVKKSENSFTIYSIGA